MAVYRVDLLTDDPKPAFEWIETHVPKACVVRAVAYKTVRGWYMKSVFKRRDHAEAFHRRWHPEADDHAVRPWGEAQQELTDGIRADRLEEEINPWPI